MCAVIIAIVVEGIKHKGNAKRRSVDGSHSPGRVEVFEGLRCYLVEIPSSPSLLSWVY